ncbi:MAG: zinc-dependent peptidase [Flavobacteriales bacterium]|nr:zinc-dependent peptidase [Flavobacteriales bacterium]
MKSSSILAFYFNRIKYGTDITRGKYKSLDKILSKYNPYYRKLSIRGKARFLNRLLVFVEDKHYLGHEGLRITYEIKAVIASAAIQLTYGLDDFSFPMYDFFHVYPNTFQLWSSEHKMRGGTAKSEKMYLSWAHITEGFDIEHDNLNLGLHEMSHAFAQEVIEFGTHTNKVAAHFREWQEASLVEYSWIKKGGKSILRSYAAATDHEFFPACVEHFFESPEEMQRELPLLFNKLSLLLNQNPLNTKNNYRWLGNDSLQLTD